MVLIATFFPTTAPPQDHNPCSSSCSPLKETQIRCIRHFQVFRIKIFSNRLKITLTHTSTLPLPSLPPPCLPHTQPIPPKSPSSLKALSSPSSTSVIKKTVVPAPSQFTSQSAMATLPPHHRLLFGARTQACCRFFRGIRRTRHQDQGVWAQNRAWVCVQVV